MRRRVHPIALPVGPAPFPSRPVGAVLFQHRVVDDLIDLDLESTVIHGPVSMILGGTAFCRERAARWDRPRRYRIANAATLFADS